MAVVGGVDRALGRGGLRWWVAGALDELAHLATAALLLRPLGFPGDLRRRGLAASVLLDVDHVPEYVFGSLVLSRRTRRPFTHSAATFAPLAAAARRRPGARAALFGVLAHLWRDCASEDGVPLAWPLSTRVLRFPYALHLLSLGACAAFGRPNR